MNAGDNPSPASWSDLLRSRHFGQVVLVCFGIWLHAADELMVSTISPAMVSDIGGERYVAWLIALYEVGSIVAGALAASMALRLGEEAPTNAQRRLLDTLGGVGSSVAVPRRTDCPGCGGLTEARRVVRTRNRWSPRRDDQSIAGPEIGEQVVRLSDPLIASYECAACGPLDSADRYLYRRAADFDDAITTCPRCAAPAVRVEIRSTFMVGELTTRFAGGPVPAKFALAEINGEAVCFDLEEESKGP